MKRTILPAIIIWLTAVASVNAASFADTYGLSPKAMSMGNAMTAHVNDWSSVYYNMAGLGRTAHLKDESSKSELFFGYMYTSPQTELDIPQRYDADGVYDTRADEDLDYGQFIIGGVLDLNWLYKMPEYISSARFGLALGVGDDFSIAKVNDIEPQTHNYLRFGREAQQMMLISGVGLGFADDTFGIGLGIKSSFGGKGRIDIDEVDISEAPQYPSEQALMDLEVDMSSWVVGLYLDFGKIAPALGGLDLGFSYRQESKFKLDPLDTVAHTLVGGIQFDLRLAVLDYYQPASYTAGLSYQCTDKLMVAFDVEYQTWSEYEVSNNQDLNYASILPDLYDIFIPRLGIQYKANTKTDLYFGYYYQPSIVPDEDVTGEVNWLDNDKHVASLGVSYDTGKWAGFQRPMVLHFGYQFQYLVDRDVIKTNPTGLNPSYSYGGTVHTIMTGVSF